MAELIFTMATVKYEMVYIRTRKYENCYEIYITQNKISQNTFGIQKCFHLKFYMKISDMNKSIYSNSWKQYSLLFSTAQEKQHQYITVCMHYMPTIGTKRMCNFNIRTFFDFRF